MKTELGPATQERLLGLVEELATQLRGAPIYPVSAPQQGEAKSLGVPASCVGHAASFLYQERDLEAFRSFVEGLDRLDTMTGPNLENPSAHHAALQRVLGPWMKRHADLSAQECLYVLSWVRRLLPKKSKPNPRANRLQDSANRRGKEESEPVRGNQMREALRKALKPT